MKGKLTCLILVLLVFVSVVFSQANEVADNIRTYITTPRDYEANPQVFQDFINTLREVINDPNDASRATWESPMTLIDNVGILVNYNSTENRLKIESIYIDDNTPTNIEIDISRFLNSINAPSDNYMGAIDSYIQASGLVFRRASSISIPITQLEEDITSSDYAGLWSKRKNAEEFNTLLDVLVQISADVEAKVDSIDAIKILYTNTGRDNSPAVKAIQVGYIERDQFVKIHTLPAEQFINDLSKIDISSNKEPSLPKYIFQQYFWDEEGEMPNNLPDKWSFGVNLKKTPSGKYSKEITVYRNGSQAVLQNDELRMQRLERKTKLNFTDIANKIIDIAVSAAVDKEQASFVSARLYMNYDMELETNKLDRIEYSIQSSNFQVLSSHENHNDLGNYYVASLFGLVPLSNTVRPGQKHIEPAQVDGGQIGVVEAMESYAFPKAENAYPVTLSVDELNFQFSLLNQRFKLGTEFGQDEFNYPFVWSGSMAYYFEWNFNEVPPITWLVDDIRVSYRPYNYANRTLINFVDYKLDNRFFEKNEGDARLAINNIQFILNKSWDYNAINEVFGWMPNSSYLKSIGYNISFQLPMTFPRDISGLGKEIYHFDMDTEGLKYSYFNRYNGAGLRFGLKDDAPINRFRLKLDEVSYSLYKVWEKRGNTIEDGRIITPRGQEFKYSQHYLSMGLSYTTDSGFKNFLFDWRFGFGDKWSSMVTVKQHLWSGTIWFEAKYAVYQTNSFKYKRVLMGGPVFYFKN